MTGAPAGWQPAPPAPRAMPVLCQHPSAVTLPCASFPSAVERASVARSAGCAPTPNRRGRPTSTAADIKPQAHGTPHSPQPTAAAFQTCARQPRRRARPTAGGRPHADRRATTTTMQVWRASASPVGAAGGDSGGVAATTAIAWPSPAAARRWRRLRHAGVVPAAASAAAAAAAAAVAAAAAAAAASAASSAASPAMAGVPLAAVPADTDDLEECPIDAAERPIVVPAFASAPTPRRRGRDPRGVCPIPPVIATSAAAMATATAAPAALGPDPTFVPPTRLVSLQGAAGEPAEVGRSPPERHLRDGPPHSPPGMWYYTRPVAATGAAAADPVPPPQPPPPATHSCRHSHITDAVVWRDAPASATPPPPLPKAPVYFVRFRARVQTDRGAPPQIAAPSAVSTPIVRQRPAAAVPDAGWCPTAAGAAATAAAAAPVSVAGMPCTPPPHPPAAPPVLAWPPPASSAAAGRWPPPPPLLPFPSPTGLWRPTVATADAFPPRPGATGYPAVAAASTDEARGWANPASSAGPRSPYVQVVSGVPSAGGGVSPEAPRVTAAAAPLTATETAAVVVAAANDAAAAGWGGAALGRGGSTATAPRPGGSNQYPAAAAAAAAATVAASWLPRCAAARDGGRGGTGGGGGRTRARAGEADDPDRTSVRWARQLRSRMAAARCNEARRQERARAKAAAAGAK